MTLTNGVMLSYSYDGASQVTGMGYKFGGSTLGNLTYAYDNRGNTCAIGIHSWPISSSLNTAASSACSSAKDFTSPSNHAARRRCKTFA